MTDAAPDWIDGDPGDLRRWRNACPEVVNPVLPDDVAITPLAPEGACPGGLICTPDRVAGVPVVYFHGGGFVVGSPETHRINTAWIAHLTRAPVISIRYRLAPEHIFPAQAEDAVAALRRQLRSHPRLRLMGDSAGGLVALWAHAGLTVEERGRIGDVVLFYPGGAASIPRPAGLGEDEAGGLGPQSLAATERAVAHRGPQPGRAGIGQGEHDIEHGLDAVPVGSESGVECRGRRSGHASSSSSASSASGSLSARSASKVPPADS